MAGLRRELMRLTFMATVGMFAVGCSGDTPHQGQSGGSSNSKDATLSCWRSFADIGRAAETKLGKNARGLQIAATYTEAAGKIDRLPLLDVDPELTSLLSKFSRDFRKLGAVYNRLSTRREDINHGMNKIGESFLRGFAGDPFSVFREEMASDRADKAALEQIKGRLRANAAELSSLRGQLTSRYQVEFPPVD